MGWNDLSLSATGSVSTNVGVTGQAAAGLRETGAGASFEQELLRQTEAGDSPETARAPATAAPAAKASATTADGFRPDSAASKQAAGSVTDDAPTDWLALLDGVRARTEARPTAEETAPLAAAVATAKAVTVPDIEPVVALATPGAGELIAVASSGAAPVAALASAPAKETEREDSDPIAASTLDGALPVLFAPVPTVTSAPQAGAPASEANTAPAAATLESVMPERLAGRMQSQPPLAAAPDPGQLDAIAARVLAAAAPQPPRPAAANAPDTPPAVEAMAQALPTATGLAAGSERLPELVPVQRHVATPLGQRGWDQAVSQQVSWLVRDQLQSASLSLNPPHLGPIQVTLQLDQQQATVQFVSAAPEVRQALQDALPALRAMLGEAGISLGQADVGSRQPNREPTAFQRPDRRRDAVEDEPIEALAQPRAQGGGLVNLFA